MTVHSSNLVCEACAVTAAVKEKGVENLDPKVLGQNRLKHPMENKEVISTISLHLIEYMKIQS